MIQAVLQPAEKQTGRPLDRPAFLLLGTGYFFASPFSALRSALAFLRSAFSLALSDLSFSLSAFTASLLPAALSDLICSRSFLTWSRSALTVGFGAFCAGVVCANAVPNASDTAIAMSARFMKLLQRKLRCFP